ncbi:hypothetical protein [Streptomyces litmocidini]
MAAHYGSSHTAPGITVAVGDPAVGVLFDAGIGRLPGRCRP